MSVKKWIRSALLAMTVVLIIAMFYNRSLTESGTEVPLSKRKALPNLAYRRIDGRLWRLSDHRVKLSF